MNPGQYLEKNLSQFIDMILFAKRMALPDSVWDELFDAIAETEQLLHQGFRVHLQEKYYARPTLMRILAKNALRKKSLTFFTIFVEDLRAMSTAVFRKQGMLETTFGDANVRMVLDLPSFGEIYKTYATGLLGTEVVFKRYMHNIHLLVKTISETNEFLKPIPKQLGNASVKTINTLLEPAYVATRKRADVALQIFIDGWTHTLPNGRQVVLASAGDLLELMFSYDSKVCVDGIEGVIKAFDQQSQLFFGDRLQNVSEMFVKLNALGLDDAEKRDVLQKYIPALFRHYVFTPNDFPGNGIANSAERLADLHRSYAERMPNVITDTLDKAKSGALASVSSNELGMIESILKAHSDQFFGQGEFILSHISDVAFDDIASTL
jgi:hypothetical protein